jgi:ribosome maturation factor RimP
VNGVRDDTQGAALEAATIEAPLGPRSLVALTDLVERTLAGMGYELVEIERAGRGLLRVTVDLVDVVDVATADSAPADAQRHIGIEDCERVSRHLTHLFAVEGVEYDRLEVSSPGMDRPLRGRRDFARFAGEMVKVQLYSAVDGRRRLRGRLLGIDEAGGAERVRLVLVPEAPAPGTRPARSAGKGAGKAARRGAHAPGETVEFALADVEKARLAPEWEFDRDAMERSAPARTT